MYEELQSEQLILYIKLLCNVLSSLVFDDENNVFVEKSEYHVG